MKVQQFQSNAKVTTKTAYVPYFGPLFGLFKDSSIEQRPSILMNSTRYEQTKFVRLSRLTAHEISRLTAPQIIYFIVLAHSTRLSRPPICNAFQEIPHQIQDVYTSALAVCLAKAFAVCQRDRSRELRDAVRFLSPISLGSAPGLTQHGRALFHAAPRVSCQDGSSRGTSQCLEGPQADVSASPAWVWLRSKDPPRLPCGAPQKFCPVGAGPNLTHRRRASRVCTPHHGPRRHRTRAGGGCGSVVCGVTGVGSGADEG